MLASAARLAGHLPPLPLNLTRIEAGESFNRSVYARCAQEEALMAAGMAAAQAASGGEGPVEPYFPHLSLLYSGDDAR